MSQLELADILIFCAPLAASAITLAALHWFPWHGGARELSRTDAYALGTTVVVGMPVAAMLLCAALGLTHGQLFWASLLVANTFVSGATVQTAYWIDSRRMLTLEDSHAPERR